MHKGIVSSLVGLAMLAGVGTAEAATRTIEYSWTGFSVFGDPFTKLGVSPVSEITGRFVFEDVPISTEVEPLSPNVVEPFTRNVFAFTSFTVNVGSFNEEAPAQNFFDVSNGGKITIPPELEEAGDEFFLEGRSTGEEGDFGPGYTLGLMGFILAYAPGTFDNESVVPSAEVLSTYTSVVSLSFDFSTPDEFGIFTDNHGFNGGEVTFTEVAPIPIPAALPLFLTALTGLGLMSWRRRKEATHAV